MCVEEFRAIGLDPVVEPFKFSKFFANFWVRGSLALFAAFFTLYLLKDWVPVLQVVFAWYGTFLAAYFLVVALVFNDPTKFRPLNIPSANIFAKLPCKGGAATAKGIIVVSAHYDSKSQRLTMKQRAVTAMVTLVLGVGVATLMVVYYAAAVAGAPLSPTIVGVIKGLLVPEIACLIVLALNRTGNASPGALDNASGMAIVFELAEWFIDPAHRLDHYEMWFVQFGAEEWGTMGSRFFLLEHLQELKRWRLKKSKTVRKERWKDGQLEVKTKKKESWKKRRFRDRKARRNYAFNVNFDTIGQHLAYLKVKGLFRRYVSKRLGDAFERAAKKLGVPIQPYYLLTGAATDRKNFSKSRIEAIDFIDPKSSVPAHSARDTPDKVDPETLVHACEIARAIIRRIDRHELRPKHPYWANVKKTLDDRTEVRQLAKTERELAREMSKIEKKIAKRLAKRTSPGTEEGTP